MSLALYRRGKVWHYRGTVAGGRLRGSTGTSDKTLAQRIAAEAEAGAWRRNLDGPEAHVTFAQAALAYRKAGKPTRFLETIENHWKDTPLRKISGGAIRQSALTLYPGVKGATHNRQVIVPTSAVINHAADLGWCTSIKVRRFPVETIGKRAASAQWVETFAANASAHLGALALFMFGTGARITEALSLSWADVDLVAGQATIRQTKINDTRTAHLPSPVVAAIANIASDRAPHERVFGYAARDSVYDAWDAAVRRAGIDRMTPHCCRHGFATTMMRAGYDVKTVAKLGGWKDAATVLKTYAHALEDTTVTDALFGTELTQPKRRRQLSNCKKRRKLT